MPIKNKIKSRPGTEPHSEEPSVVLKIRSLLDKFEGQMNEGDFKMSVADYIRLIQMKQELDSTQPQNVEVSWVDHLDEHGEKEK